MAEKKTMPYIDILKFVFAILIFLLHKGILSLIPYYSVMQAVTARIAVPFFFVASGYFFANKLIYLQSIEERKATTYNYCKRLGSKLLIFEPISIIILTAGRLVEHMALKDILSTTIKEILFYPRGALWYIQAVIIAAIIMFPFIHFKKEKTAIIPAVLFYIFALFGNRYNFMIKGTFFGSFMDVYEGIFITVRNGVFEGIPFMLCGCLIARYQDFLRALKGRILIYICIFSFIIVVFENLLLRPYTGHDDNSLYISYLIAVPSLFSVALFALDNNKFGEKTKVFRNLSTSIYLLHSPIGRIVKYIMSYLAHNENVLINGAISATLISAICLIVYKYKIKPFYGWLI